jgi:AraC family transcriptional activator of tynA and feaB
MAKKQSPHWRKWSSSDYRPKERFEAWQEALNQSHLSWSLSGPVDKGFSANIQVGSLQDLQVVSCACQPCSGYRGSQEIAGSNEAFYGLLLICQGHEEVEVGSQSALLGPGNILLWDSTIPIRFKLHSPIRKITVLVPQSKMRDALPQTRRLVGKAIDWRRGLGAVAASHITALGSQACYIERDQTRPAAETALELIATSLGSQQAEANEATRAEMYARIKRYISSNLDDPDLGPRSLAKKFGISLRYLHLLFSREGVTVSRLILDRRLAKCHRELVVAGPHKNITEVALNWGFNDAAHFSRAFKKRYGMSPRDYRQGKRNEDAFKPPVKN